MASLRNVLPMKPWQPQNIAGFALLVLIGIILSGCGIAQASEDEIEQAWQTSAHADIESGAFTRWNDDDPAEIPENCAKCHSTSGYQDYLGLDGAPEAWADLWFYSNPIFVYVQ